MNQITELVDNSFIFTVTISVILLVGITAAMIYFVFRYSEKNNPKPDQSITGSTTLEILWTVVPVLLVLAMFFYGYEGFREMRNIPPNAMLVKVTGKMWFWHFEYENKKTSDTVLVLPAGKDVRFELQSVDVIHSFYVPAFRVKEDCVPGRTNHLWFHTSTEGVYDIECAEYCGMNHSYMLGKVKILPEKEFLEWVNKVDTVKKSDSVSAPPTGNVKTDSTNNSQVKTDSSKTTQVKTDSTKSPVKKPDSLKVNRKDSIKKNK